MNSSLLCVVLLAILATTFAQTVDPTKTIVVGNGISNGTVGTSTFFLIQPIDTNGNKITSCQVTFSVTLLDNKGDNVPLTNKCNNGGQTFVYMAKVSNLYNLTITYNGSPVAKSPYTLFLAPGPISVPGCIQKGLKASSTAGQLYSFQITAYDTYNNRIYSCPSNANTYWTIVFQGILNNTATNYTCSSGVWTVSYVITRSGPYQLWITAEKLNIYNSPFSVAILAGSIYAKNTYASSDGASAATAGASEFFNINTEDFYGNPINICYGSAPYSDWTVYLLSPSNAKVYLNNNISCSAGLYTVTYNVTLAGSWKLYIFYQNVSTSNAGSVIAVSASPVLYGPNLVASGPGLTSAVAGVPAQFSITPYDAFGNQISQCDDDVTNSSWAITVTSLDGQHSCSATETSCDSQFFTYTIQYTCKKSTSYSIDIDYFGQSIKNSPQNKLFVVPGPISGPATIVSGAGLSNAYAGEPAPIELDTYDQYNNKITTCNTTASVFVIDVKVLGTGIDIHGSINSCNNGNYFASYIITQLKGFPFYSLVISFQGNTINSTTVNTHPGYPSFNNCKVSGNTTLTAGDTGSIQVQCSDQFNNPITDCIQNNWNVVLFGPNTTIVNPNYGGCTQNPGGQPSTYSWTYYVTVAGQYSSNISYVGGHGYYNNLNVLVNPAAFYAANSIAVGVGVTSQLLSVDTNATFSILSRDQFGNNVNNCSAQTAITVSIVGSDGTKIYPYVAPCSSGVIPVSYHSFKVGGVTVSVNYNSQPIKNSPYQVAWVAGNIFPGNCKVSGNGLTSGTAGQSSSYNFYCEDQYGNVIYQCNTNVTTDWSVPLLSGPNSGNFKGVVSSCSGGTYNGWWYAEKIGTYKFQINYLGTQIAGTAFSPVLYPAVLSSNNSIATTTGLSGTFQAGAVITFSINGFDRFNNPISTCLNSEHIESHENVISVLGAKSNIEGASRYISSASTSTYWTTTLQANGSVVSQFTQSTCVNGTYLVAYNYIHTGTIKVVVTGNDAGHPINTPGQIVITPGPAYPPNMEGSLASKNNYIAGAPINILVIAYDNYSNPIMTCLNDYSQFDVYATWLSNRLYNGSVTSCSGGVYVATIMIPEPNVPFNVFVKFNNSQTGSQNVHNSPWSVTLTDGSFSAVYSIATGPGVSSDSVLIAGHTQNFTITLYNQYNVPILLDGTFCNSVNNDWTLVFLVENTVPSIPWNNITLKHVQGYCDASGRIVIQYNITLASYFNLNINWNQNANVSLPVGGQNGTYSLRIRPDQLIPSTIVIGNIPQSVVTSGNFTLIGYDRWHNLADFSGVDGSKLSIDFSPHCIPNYPPVCTAGYTSYMCSFNASVGGVYCLSILYDNKTIGQQSVYQILVQGGYQCGSCNGGYCLVTSFSSASNTTTNTTTNSTTNSTNTTNPNFAGINTACHCPTGYTGTDCSVEIKSHYMGLGLAIGLIVGLAILLLIIGLVAGYFFARSRNKDSDYLNRGLIDS